jgi:dihydrolipoamide dehydrogenase
VASYDFIIIGSGPGGYVAAIRAAQLGAGVALVEARDLGGVCLNRGCIPTKAILESARAFGHMKEARRYGLTCEAPGVDFAAVAQRKQGVTERLRRGVEMLLTKSQVDVVRGIGRVADAGTVIVAAEGGEVTLKGRNIIVATGSEPARPKMFPIDDKRVLTSDGALELTALPAEVLIVGGGYIGCEFAAAWAEFGSKVTVVEMLPRLLPQSDEDLSKEMERILKRRRVKVHTGVRIEKMTAGEDGVIAELSEGKSVTAEKALVAVGRELNSHVAGLVELGVATDLQAIAVDEFCRTNIDGVYAIGDVTGKWMLAHYASEQGVVAVEHALGHGPEPINDDAVPSCVFTLPEIASVGLTEAQAREKDPNVRVGRFDFAALGKAQASGDTTGFVKVIADDTGRILGVHMVGHEVTSIIAEATLAVRCRHTVEDLVHTIHTHPTMPEAFHEAALDVLGRAIHKV